MAAKTYTLNKYDNKFINDLLLAGVPTASVTKWITTWEKTEPTYNKKADYMYAMYKSALANKSVDATALLNAAGTWAQSYNPDLINPVTKKPYNLVAFKNAVREGSLGDTSLNAKEQPVLTQIQQARQLQGESIAASLGDNLTGAEKTASAKAIMSGSATNQFDPDAIRTQYINAVGDYAVKPEDTAATLEARYGGLKNSSGKPLFTSDDFKQVIAGGEDTKLAFNDKIQSYVDKVITTTNGDLVNKTGSLTYRTAANALLNDPSKLVDSYNSNVAKLTKDATTGDWAKTSTTTTPTDGITGLLPKGSFKDANGNFAYTGGEIEPDKMTEFTQSYNPNKGVYRAPSLDASGKLVANSTSPYSNILNGMLSGYKNPYAAGYTNQLTMPETPDLTNIKKPFENNPTSKDLLKLANTAGQPYDPNAITSLSPALSKIYQPSITNSAGKATKPGAPDTTNTTLPVVPKAGEPIVTDTSAGKLAAEKLAAEKLAAEKLAAEKLAAEKLAAEKLAAGKMKWVQDLQNSSNTPVDYYTKLANNTLYSDLASTGKAALESYKSLPAVAPEVAKSTYLQEAQTSSKTPVEYYTKLANSTAYPDLQAAGQSGLAALNAQQNAPVTTPITQQPLGAPQPVTIDSSAEQARKALGTPQPVTIDSSAEQARKALGTPQQFTLTSPNQPQQFTLTSPNQPQSVTLGSGVAGVVDPSVVSKSNLNTDASSAYGTGIVPNLNQQAQAASVPFTSAQQVVDLQKLQNTPGITAEQYYAALAANPTYAAAGQSGIAALQNKPAPIVPAAPQGTPQTFTLT